jgi:hypothetical protein
MYYPGISLPEFRVGDSTSSGRAILDVAAEGAMEVRVKVSEQERPNIASGQLAEVRSDALPGRAFGARVASIAAFAAKSGDPAGPLRQFDVVLKLDQVVADLRAGTTVRVAITGTEISDVLTVPRQALFQKNGATVVYVRSGERFESREVKPTHRSESRIAIDGLPAGAEVALVNPERTAASPIQPGAPLPAAGGMR